MKECSNSKKKKWLKVIPSKKEMRPWTLAVRSGYMFEFEVDIDLRKESLIEGYNTC